MKYVYMAVALVGACLAGCTRPAAEGTPPPENSKPDVRVVTSDALVNEIAYAQGRPVIVNFWATWCPPCVEEMPLFVSFYREHSDQVDFFSVSVDHPDTVEDRVRPFMQTNKLPFTVFVLSDRSPERVADALRLDWQGQLPATIVLDKEGNILRKQLEGIDDGWLADALASLQ